MRQLFFSFFLLCAISAWADKQPNDTIQVRGEVVDNFTREVIDSVFMEVLMPDTTTVVDTLWNLRHDKINEGWWGAWEMPGYHFKLPQHGNYLLRCTKRGYKPNITTLNIPRKRYNKKVREWENDPILLKKSNSYDFDSDMKEVTVTATRIKMFQDGDTVIYNADAFELSEGSMLDELIRQLPGVELKDGGEIYVNGHKVDELLLNGKHFFQGDAKTALDNLPAYMINNVKAYQRADDKAYLDKHHEEMKKKDPWVIDVNLKRQYNTGWIGNVEGGLSPYPASASSGGMRYIGRLFLTRFTDHSRLTIMAGANNINNMGQPGSEGSWSDWSSPTSEMDILNGAIDFHVDSKTTKTEMNTRLNVSRTKSTSHTDQSGVNFLPTGDVYNRNRSENESVTTTISWNADLQMPRKESFLTLSPNVNYSRSKSNGFNLSATFDADPCDTVRGQSLDELFAPMGSARLEKILTNRTKDVTKGEQTSLDAGLGAFYYMIAPWNGEMINMSIRTSYSHSEGKDFSQYDLRHPAASAADDQFLNRYTLTPSNNVSASASLGHDIWEFGFGTIGLHYQFNFRYNKGSRDLYDLHKLDGWGQGSTYPIGLLPSMTDELNLCIDKKNSYNSLTRDFDNNVAMSLQKGGDWGYYFLNISLNSQNQYQEDTRGKVPSIQRTFALPNANFSFKWKDIDGQVGFSQSAPGLSQLMEIRDDSNPLSISLGNANLKNTSMENFGLQYSKHNMERQMNWNVGLNASLMQNSIGNAMTYNRETGVYTYQPWNISGNWNMGLNGNVYLSLGKQKYWTLRNMTNLNYQCSVDFMQEGDVPESADQLGISRVHNYTASDNLQLRFQKGGYTASFNADVDYTHADSKRDNFHAINTVNFSYGVACTLKLPWQFEFDTDLTMHSRRGYEDKTMNKNYLVWNAALSKAFLKSKNLIVKLRGHDILQQLENVQRNINAQGRTETWYNTQPSYGLLSVAYRLNLNPKKKK